MEMADVAAHIMVRLEAEWYYGNLVEISTTDTPPICASWPQHTKQNVNHSLSNVLASTLMQERRTVAVPSLRDLARPITTVLALRRNLLISR